MPKPEMTILNVKQIIERIITLIKSKILDYGINLQVYIESDELEMLADKSLIEQVFLNLILNAIDAVQEMKNPSLIIKAQSENENHVIISFKDNGNGISESEIENIFIPFFTTKDKGSGIGLSITKQIMFMHKANIVVKSEPGAGAEFTLTF
jgi:signal transduction histidine kinase